MRRRDESKGKIEEAHKMNEKRRVEQSRVEWSRGKINDEKEINEIRRVKEGYRITIKRMRREDKTRVVNRRDREWEQNK